jgi:hypothetical protein
MSVTLNASTSSGLVQTADTSGTIELQSNGTTKLTVSSTGAYGQLVSATAQTASSTAVDFTGIPSWVKRITVMFSGVSTNGTSNPLIQLGDAGGFETTGYSATSLESTTTHYTTGFGIRFASASAVLNGSYVFTLVGSNAWTGIGLINNTSTAVATCCGVKTLSDTLTQIRITTVNGTDQFDAGTINILFEG